MCKTNITLFCRLKLKARVIFLDPLGLRTEKFCINVFDVDFNFLGEYAVART
jgi:hypothetical protein